MAYGGNRRGSVENRARRLTAMVALTVVVFSYLGARLFQLQVLGGREFRRMSMANSLRIQPDPAPRGDILDRNGVPIATSRLGRSVYTRASLGKGDAKLLAELTGIPEREILERVSDSPTGWVPIVRDAGIGLVSALSEGGSPNGGITVRDEPVRFYPLGEAAAHLSGYLADLPKGRGETGVEGLLDSALTGVDGGRRVLVDSRGRVSGSLGYQEPVKGTDVRTTIDVRLQATAIAALEEYGDRNPPGARGAVIAMDARSGAVRALASLPSYDPNVFVTGYGGGPAVILGSTGYPLLNRAVSGLYPPGSTFKPMTAVAAVEEGVADKASVFDCRGYDPVIPGKKCWIVAEGLVHGREDLVEGIKHSCNIVFYELGRRLGPDALSRWSRRFGLGRPLGFGAAALGPAGTVPSSEWKESRLGVGWYPAETLDFSIGQGFLTVTPMHMARMFCAFANGRSLPHPYVVERIGDEPATTGEGGPGKADPIRISGKTLGLVRKGLREVVKPGGTAHGAFADSGVAVAGKTGSAQNPSGRAHAWFAGYAPADRPEIVVVVLVEQGESGSRAAAPVARRVFDAWAEVKSGGKAPA